MDFVHRAIEGMAVLFVLSVVYAGSQYLVDLAIPEPQPPIQVGAREHLNPVFRGCFTTPCGPRYTFDEPSEN